jgi:hypothetical protein
MARYQNPSPSAPFLASLFGYQAGLNRKGAFKLMGETPGGLFGPAAQANISDYLNLGGNNQFTQALGNIGRTGNFQQLPSELLGPYNQATSTLDQLISSSRPVVASLIETGNPVDIGSVVNAAQSRFQNVLLPSIAERYNPSQGTGFQNIAAREADLLAAELGQLDYSAQEAARSRQMEALTVAAPSLASLTTARMQVPSAALGELSSLSDSTDPGARLMQGLLSLLGYTQQPAELVRNSPDSGGGSGWAEVISGIVNPLGSILCWVADELFGPLDVRATLARVWCYSNLDHPFVQLYAAEGKGWAEWLHENPWAKRIVAPVWEQMAKRGAALLRDK